MCTRHEDIAENGVIAHSHLMLGLKLMIWYSNRIEIGEDPFIAKHFASGVSGGTVTNNRKSQFHLMGKVRKSSTLGMLLKKKSVNLPMPEGLVNILRKIV